LADIYTLDLYPNNICINNNLIDEGYCRKYTGGTKIDWNLTSSDILVDINNTNSIVENSPRIKRKYTKKIKN